MCSVASKLGSIEEELGMERGREGGLNQEAIRQGSPGQRSLDEHGTNFARACKWILSCSIYCVYIYIVYHCSASWNEGFEWLYGSCSSWNIDPTKPSWSSWEVIPTSDSLHCWKSTPPFLTPASVGSLFPPRFTWDIHDTQVPLLKSSWIRTTPWGAPGGEGDPDWSLGGSPPGDRHALFPLLLL